MSAELPRSGRIEAGEHHFPVRVYYEDTDAAGLVYHANYLKFAERARTEMLRCAGLEQERLRHDSGFVLVVRRSTIDFRNAARLDDDLVVASRLLAHGGATLDLAQEIRRDGELLVHLDNKIACLGAGGRPTRLPPALIAAIALFSRPLPTGATAHAR